MFQLSTELRVLGGLLVSDSSYHPRWCQGAYHAACPAFAVARDGVVFDVTLVKHLFDFHGANGSVVKDESHCPS